MEIIGRKIKEDLRIGAPNFKLQIAYNNYGHLVFRLFDPEKPEKDILVVFTTAQTNEIIAFLRKLRLV